MGLLDGKVALITGGARGQGRAHARTCAREGADVVLFDVPRSLSTVPYALAGRDELDQTVALVEQQGRSALAFAGDVRSQSDLDAAIAETIGRFGRLDIVIANAGIWTFGPPFWELTEEQWNEVIDVNFSGTWKTVKAAAPALLRQQAGSVVVTASINGFEAGAGYSQYSAAKHGLLGLVKNMALELAPHGIRCNAICPGPTDTPMTDHQAAYDLFGGSRAGWEDGGRNFAALRGKGWLDPQTMADAALFLNSDLATAITGIALPVDAGHLILPGFNHEPVR